jgi:hypothetical protein
MAITIMIDSNHSNNDNNDITGINAHSSLPHGLWIWTETRKQFLQLGSPTWVLGFFFLNE